MENLCPSCGQPSGHVIDGKCSERCYRQAKAARRRVKKKTWEQMTPEERIAFGLQELYAGRARVNH